MASGLWSGLGKLVNAGAAYMQHVNFANQLLNAPPRDAGTQWQRYTQGLSEASFAGLKVTLSMLVNQEQDPARKAGLQRLLASADAARQGASLPAALAPAPAPAQAPASTQGASFDEDVALTCGWYDNLDGPGRDRALTAHLRALSPAGCQSFITSVQQMIENIDGNIRAHAEAEGQAWGGSFEDRMAYGMARLQTGQHDPAWQTQMKSLQDVRSFFCALLEAAQRHSSERQQARQPRAAPAVPASASPDPQAVLAQVQAFVGSGQYPGGAEKMQADVAALVMAGQGDEVMAYLKNLGAMDVGSKPLVAEDHYVDGPEPYTPRWPVQFPLPLPFDELPRPLQFSVLFGEWTRREMEGSYAMSQGQHDAAGDAFRECLERAQQIAVPELVARSHEGLARLAAKLNDRALERRHLKAAIAARAGT